MKPTGDGNKSRKPRSKVKDIVQRSTESDEATRFSARLASGTTRHPPSGHARIRIQGAPIQPACVRRWKGRFDDRAADRDADLDRCRCDRHAEEQFTCMSAKVQTVLEQNPFSGHVFVFRGRRGDLIKVLWWDGDGLCLFAKRLERGTIRLAAGRERDGGVEPCAVVDVAGRHRLATAPTNAAAVHCGVDQYRPGAVASSR